ncbi:MAG TPA: hypothetical protein VIK52_06350 [Opitutaceae bacterium]
MKAVRGSFAAVMAVFVATGSSLFASAQVNEELIGVQGRWISSKVSPRGLHTAVLVMKGSRFAVVVDGVEGPRIDQLIGTDGQPAVMGGPDVAANQVNLLQVVFSDNGERCAYFAKVGGDFIAVLDGKEIFRGPTSYNNSRRGMFFSAGGKHLFFTDSDGDAGNRIVVDGAPGPWSHDTPEVVTSHDGAHYAYVGTVTDYTGTKWAVVDGKQVKYFGRSLRFTANGSLLSIMDGQGVAALILNGKPLIQAAGIEPLWVSPTGGMVAAMVSPKPGAQMVLTVNGNVVPGTEGVGITGVSFSPDGKRYAAVCLSVSGSSFMIIDGKRGLDYQSVSDPCNTTPGFAPQTAGFTSDSSKYFYVANTSQAFLVVEDEESDGVSGVIQPAVAPNGNRIGFTANANGRQYVVIEGQSKEYRGANNLFFSPDGSRYAFLAYSGTSSLYVDGVEQSGIVVSPFTRTYEMPAANIGFLFSPDSKHIAVPGYLTADSEKRGLFIDGQFVPQSKGISQFRRPMFTPDSRHLYWISPRVTDGGGDRDNFWLYLDGVQVAKFAGADALERLPENWEMSADGTLRFVALSGGELKRFKVTPPADTGIETLLAGVAPVTAPAPASTSAPQSPIAAVAGALSKPGDSNSNQLLNVVASVVAAAIQSDKKDSGKPAESTKPTAAPPVARAETPAEAAAEAAKLTWQELANRPELWPSQVTVKVQMDFQGGASVRAGQNVNVVQIRADEIDLSTADGQLNFVTAPEECDALEVARAGYAKLTPKQRRLTFGSLVSSKELWPLKVVLNQTFDLGGGRVVRAGDEMTVLDFQAGKLLVKSEALNVQFHVAPQATDIMAQCRRFVEDESAGPRLVATQKAAEERLKARGIVVTELDGRLVNSVTAKPQPLDEAALPKYIVFLRGSSTCTITRGFMPSMVKFYNEQKPRHPEFEVVYIMTESPGDTGKFAREAGFSWRAVEYESTGYMPSVSRQIDGKLPQLIVMDRNGKVLANGIQNGAPAALNQLAALLK